jgi:hypothetical protein
VTLERALPPVKSVELLTILDEIPESIPVGEYQRLIPRLASLVFSPVDTQQSDWSDEYVTSRNDESDSQPEPDAVTRPMLVQWYEQRVLALERLGFVGNAQQLCQWAIESQALHELAPLERLVHLAILLNSCSNEIVTLSAVRDLTDEQILGAILDTSSTMSDDELDKQLEYVLVPSLGLVRHATDTLTKIFVDKLHDEHEHVALVALARLFKTKKIFVGPAFHGFVRTAILGIDAAGQLPVAQQLLTLLDDRAELEQLLESVRHTTMRAPLPTTLSF